MTIVRKPSPLWVLSEEYARACAESHSLQSWWREKPENTKGGHGNIRMGDLVWFRGQIHVSGPQIVVIGTMTINVRVGKDPYLSYEVFGEKGGYSYSQTHETIRESGWVWIPRPDQLGMTLKHGLRLLAEAEKGGDFK